MSVFENLTKSIAEIMSKCVSQIKTTATKNTEALATGPEWNSASLRSLFKKSPHAGSHKANNARTIRCRRKLKRMMSQIGCHPFSNATSNEHNANGFCCSLMGIGNRDASASASCESPTLGNVVGRPSCCCIRTPSIISNLRTILSKYKTLALTPINHHYQHQIVRTKCGRENCADPCTWPLCPPINTNYKKNDSRLHNIYASYWDARDDDCCDDPCKWTQPHPRFDDIYHRESDKDKRIYTRTWAECPPIIKPKRICCYDGVPPEICLRPKNIRPQTACPQDFCTEGDMRCPKIRMPCCCDVRKNLRCRPLTRGPLKCKRYCTPYPAFSECLKPRIRPPRKVECSCLNSISMCEVYAYWRKRIMGRAGVKC